MKWKQDGVRKRMMKLAGFTLISALMAAAAGPGTFAQETSADTKTPDANTSSHESGPQILQTFYLSSAARDTDGLDVQTDLRNMLPRAKVYYVQSQNALTMLGSAADIQLAQKLLADLDRTKKLYRLTYTITETDGEKRIGVQHYALIVASGGKSVLKQGSRVPIATGTYNAGGPTQNSQVQYQYLDLGLNIDASLVGYLDSVRLQTKVEQSSISEEHSGMGPQDPVIRQTQLEGTATLIAGKPLVLGSLDIPGSTRHQEIEVVSELVR